MQAKVCDRDKKKVILDSDKSYTFKAVLADEDGIVKEVKYEDLCERCAGIVEDLMKRIAKEEVPNKGVRQPKQKEILTDKKEQ